MSWLPGSRGNAESPQPQSKDGSGPGSSRGAMPPQCPRCEVTKSQFNRTIQNYQKAYRKKVEGLKTELKAVRNTNQSLRQQVKQLKGVFRVHAPSLIVGAVAGALIRNYWNAIRRYLTKNGKQQSNGVDTDTHADNDNSPADNGTTPPLVELSLSKDT